MSDCPDRLRGSSRRVELFADDATLAFVGVPVGPFEGAWRDRGRVRGATSTDTMTVLSVDVEDDGSLVEPFSWSADGGERSGEMRLVVGGDRIRRLVVAFE